MAITLTENAAKKIQAKLVKNGKEGLGLRVGVKKVGCSGFAYTFDYTDEIRAGDQVFESHNVMLPVPVSVTNSRLASGVSASASREAPLRVLGRFTMHVA